MDANFGEAERRKITDLVRARFELTEAEAESLLEIAGDKVANSSQLYSFTRVVKDNFDHAERVELMEMLWEVVYADGALHHLEASLMRPRSESHAACRRPDLCPGPRKRRGAQARAQQARIGRMTVPPRGILWRTCGGKWRREARL
jgi:hypothetical protein